VLAILIPTIWLTLAAFFVLLCRMAARGDEDVASPPMARIMLSPRGTFVISQPARRRTAATSCHTGARTGRGAVRTQRAAHSGRQRP
jgi:hypothetical protein